MSYLRTNMTSSSYFSVNQRGHLQIESSDCADLVNRYGTPLYVFSENTIRSNYRLFLDAFSSRYPKEKILVCFGNKSNFDLAIRKILTSEGAGADVFGLGELYVALMAGTDPRKIVFNGSGKSEEQLRAAVESGVCINVDNLPELEMLEEVANQQGRLTEINIRVKPYIKALENAIVKDWSYRPPDISIAKWLREYKFGMLPPTALEACRTALKMENIRLVGISTHFTSQAPYLQYYEVYVNEVMDFIADVKSKLNWNPQQIDFGSGFPVNREEVGTGPGGTAIDVPTVHQYAELFVSRVKEKCERFGIPEPVLMFEPGRCIVTDAAVLLGKVVLVKEEPSALEGEKNRWIHVDCSTNDALNIISQGWRYHIAIANRMNQRPEYVADVCGPLCDAADVLASNTRVPKTNPGDIVAMFDMGSYAESKHCVRNCYPMPMTVLVSGDKIAVVRDRETVQDMLARDRIPYWLLAS